jgi:hypothetical protein
LIHRILTFPSPFVFAFSITKDDTIHLIDPRKPKVTKVIKSGDRREVNEFAWNRDSTLFLITTGAGTILVCCHIISS